MKEMIVPMPASQNGKPDLSAVNASGEHLGGLVFTAIAVYAYVFIAVASTSPKDLLVGTDKQIPLPLINASIPLMYFYITAPLLLLLVHAYLLLSSRLAFEKLSRLAVHEHIEELQWHGFVALMLRNDVFGWFGRIFFYTIAAAAPLASLLFIEMTFLAYQNRLSTWLQGFLALLDGLFIISIATWKESTEKEVLHLPWRWLPFLMGLMGAVSAVTLATISMRSPLARVEASEALIVAKEPAGEKFNEAGTPADATLRYGMGADLRGRSLRFSKLNRSILTNADLREVDFSGADLSYADLRRSKLSGADFRDANLRGARFEGSTGESIIFTRANLQDAFLSGIRFKKASFQDADLTGAKIHWSVFEGGDFNLANLYRTSLIGSRFDKTSFIGTQALATDIRRCLFFKTNLTLARFNEAQIQGVVLDLRRNESHGSIFEATKLNFVQADNLNGASLRGARISENGTRIGQSGVADARAIKMVAPDIDASDLQEQAKAELGMVIKSIGRREGDLLDVEYERNQIDIKEKPEKSCLFCSAEQASAENGETQTDASVATAQKEIFYSLVEMSVRRGNDNKARHVAEMIGVALLRELEHCFPPPRDPDWPDLMKRLDRDQRLELDRLRSKQGSVVICPWWQQGGAAKRR